MYGISNNEYRLTNVLYLKGARSASANTTICDMLLIDGSLVEKAIFFQLRLDFAIVNLCAFVPEKQWDFKVDELHPIFQYKKLGWSSEYLHLMILPWPNW